MKLLYFIPFLLTVNVFGTSYFVSNSGNNANNGLSPMNAFATLQKGADVARSGDSVLVANGTYAGFDYRRIGVQARDSVVFFALGNNVLINSKGPLRFDGINIEGTTGKELIAIEVNGFKIIGLGANGNGIRLVFADHCIVRHCTSSLNERGIFTGFTDKLLLEYNICSFSLDEHGIYLSNSSDDAIIRYNHSFGNNNIGIHMNGDTTQGEDGIIHDPILYGNAIYNNKLAAGINMDGVDGAIIFNNLIYNNFNCQGIILFKQDGRIVSKNAKIFNNTIVVPDTARWGILMYPGAEAGTSIYNNIIHSFHDFRGVIGVGGTNGLKSDYNILQENRLGLNVDNSTVSFATWQAQGLDLHSILATSHTSFTNLFINQDTLDFHLAASSLARDAGTDMVSAIVMEDYDGVPRPVSSSYDIGAFEYQTALAVSDIGTFKAQLYGDYISIEWSYDSKGEGEKLILEKSIDGQHFEKLHDVMLYDGKAPYVFIDKSPIDGYNYYRLNTVGTSGQSETSKSISIFYESNEVLFYPNPSKGMLNFERPENINSLKVFSADGRLVKVYGLVGKSLGLDLPSGLYFLQIKGEGFSRLRQLIIE